MAVNCLVKGVAVTVIGFDVPVFIFDKFQVLNIK